MKTSRSFLYARRRVRVILHDRRWSSCMTKASLLARPRMVMPDVSFKVLIKSGNSSSGTSDCLIINTITINIRNEVPEELHFCISFHFRTIQSNKLTKTSSEKSVYTKVSLQGGTSGRIFMPKCFIIK